MTFEPNLALRDEYLEAKLRCAARVMWLVQGGGSEGRPFEAPEDYVAAEAAMLARTLDIGPDATWLGQLEAYVLRLLGIVQSYASSSACIERPEPEGVADFDPVASGSA